MPLENKQIHQTNMGKLGVGVGGVELAGIGRLSASRNSRTPSFIWGRPEIGSQGVGPRRPKTLKKRHLGSSERLGKGSGSAGGCPFRDSLWDRLLPISVTRCAFRTYKIKLICSC